MDSRCADDPRLRSLANRIVDKFCESRAIAPESRELELGARELRAAALFVASKLTDGDRLLDIEKLCGDVLEVDKVLFYENEILVALDFPSRPEEVLKESAQFT